MTRKATSARSLMLLTACNSRHEIRNEQFELDWESSCSVRHLADDGFNFRRVHHLDGVPWAAIKEAAVRAFANALFAADAKDGIDLNSSERRIGFVRNPEHAVFHRAILNAGGRTGASRAALGNYRE